MRTNKSPLEFLKAVAKKKPRLQELLDNVFKMSPADIDALSEPLWVKQALHSCRTNDHTEMYVAARLAQVVEAEKKMAELPRPTFEVRIWNSPTAFIGGDSSSLIDRWKIEVSPNDSFMVVDDLFVRFGDSALKVQATERQTLLQGSKLVGYMTLDNYRGFHRALLNQKHKHI